MTDLTQRPAAVLNTEDNQQSRVMSFARTGRIQTTPVRGRTSAGRYLPTWTEERIAKLKKLWERGLTGSQIATEFGDVSRHAVIAKARRLYLPGRDNTRPGRQAKHRPPAPPIDDQMIPISQRKTFAELEPWHCHYPVGDPGTPAFFFCGGAIAEDLYCASHWARCHMEMPRRGR